MGLAAGQARMMMLTARKSDIIAGQMKKANTKMDLARNQSELSTEYSNALNRRKLMWSVDGSPTGDSALDLTYDLLMRPNSTNIASQYMITDVNGRVVLSDSYLNALGLTANSGNGTGMSRNEFLDKFGIDGDVYSDDPYVAGPTTPTSTTGSTTPGYVPRSSMSDSDAKNVKDLLAVYVANIRTACQAPQTAEAYAAVLAAVDNSINKVKGLIQTLEASGVTPGTLANPTAAPPTPAVGTDAQLDLAQYKKELLALNKQKQILELANSINTTNYLPGGMDPNVDPSADSGTAMLDYRKQFMLALLTGENANTGVYDAFDRKSFNPWESCVAPLNLWLEQNGYAVRAGFANNHDNDRWNGQYQFSGGGLYDLIGDARKNSTPATSGTGTGGNGGQGPLQNLADFYTNMYYALEDNGWVRNSFINNKSYMQNQLMNNNLYIKQLNNLGGWDFLSSGGALTPLRDVRDKDGEALATTEYNQKKDQLTAKELKLDMEMKQDDAEYAAITAEIGSVESILKEAVKTFKMFG